MLISLVSRLRISFLFLYIKLIYLPIIFDVTLLSALSKYLVSELVTPDD